ncbi:hypothetical protein [Nocardioides sp. W7]|uniref:hypothetical protein n=1 Tax=Nocardioides sp. W7 TaxID=2931390 RepID=UPI001FD12A52|nr:hypothetical protein [Nocardioides sp. W7]
MRRPGPTAFAATIAGCLTSVLLAPLNPAHADVGVTQEARLVGDKPVSGRYGIAFNDYGANRGNYCPPRAGQCWPLGRAVARGTLETKLSVYRIKDGMKKYDYYLLDVDVVAADRVGKHRGGTVTIGVTSLGPRLVDHTDTKTLRATQGDCHSVDIGFSTPWPVIDASADLGSVTWCSDSASLSRTTSGTTARWSLKGLGRTHHLAVDRAVKVRAGKKPRFRVDVTVPRDTCTRAIRGKCVDYRGGTASASYRVGSRG